MKLFLTIESGSLAGQTFDLMSGFITIGRSDNCSVRFDPLNEKIASKQHAFIEAKDDGFYLTDNSSTNGTFVNGEQIQTAKLNSGDTIQFGRNGNTARVSIETQTFNEPMSAPTVFHPNADFGQFQASPTQFTPLAAPQLSFKNTLSGLGYKSSRNRTRTAAQSDEKIHYYRLDDLRRSFYVFDRDASDVLQRRSGRGGDRHIRRFYARDVLSFASALARPIRSRTALASRARLCVGRTRFRDRVIYHQYGDQYRRGKH